MRHPDERPHTGSLDGHFDEGTIHAWLDGALSATEGAALERHAVACAGCRDAIAEARGLIAASSRIVAALDGIPAGVLPDRAPVAAPELTAASVATGAVIADLRDGAVVRSAVRPRALRWSNRVRAIAAVAVVVVGASLLLDRAGGPAGVADLLSGDEEVAASARATDASFEAAAGSGATAQRELSELGVPEVPEIPASPRGVAGAAPAARSPIQAAEKVQELNAVVAADQQAARTAPDVLPEPVPVPVPPPLPLAPTGATALSATSDAVGRAARQESRPPAPSSPALQRGAVAAAAPSAPAQAPPPPPAVSPPPPAMLGGAAVRSAFAPTPALSGQVTDAATGTPVAGAIVSVEGAESTALTDGEGRFLLQRIPAGPQTALVRRVGFESARVPVEIPDSAGAAGQVVVRLRPSTTVAGELEVPDVPVDPRRESSAALRARQYADCYRLEVAGREGAARDAVERALPGSLALTLQPTEPPQWYRVESRTQVAGRGGYWRSSDRQRIELIWLSPQGELRLRLGGSSTASELTGRAQWAPGATVAAAGGADVRLRRTGCDVPSR